MKTFTLRSLYLLLSISLTVASTQPGLAQCVTAPVAATCTGGNGPASNGENINAGQTFWFKGATTFFPSGVSLNGGTLRVCGDLILQSINFNDGSSLIIEKGGKLIIKAATTLNVNGNGKIINRGTLIIDGDLTTQNVNNIVWNDAPTAVFEVKGTFNISAAGNKFMNKGKAIFNSFLVQTGVSVCTYENSCITTGYYQNNFLNSIIYAGVAGGRSVVNVTSQAQLNQTVTSSSSVIACIGKTAIHTGSKGVLGWGSATMSTNCTSCASALPTNITVFKAVRNQSSVQLQWETAEEINGNYFTIERSSDGHLFTEILKVPNKKLSESVTSYTAIDASPLAGTCYYRLKHVNMEGKGKDFNVIRLQAATGINEIYLYPTLVKGTEKITFTASTTRAESIKIYLLSSDGKQVVNQTYALTKGAGSFTFNMPVVASGVYYMHVASTNSALVYSKKIMVTN